MTGEMVKADEGLVGIVKQFAERAVKLAESTEQLKAAPFVEAAMGLTDVITEMACALARSLPPGTQVYNFYPDYCNRLIKASPTSVYVEEQHFYLRINPMNKKVKIKKRDKVFYSKPSNFFSRLEPEFKSNERTAVFVFEEYASLPQRFSEFAAQVHYGAENREAQIRQAMQAREVPGVEINIEDPLKEKFRLLEAGGVK